MAKKIVLLHLCIATAGAFQLLACRRPAVAPIAITCEEELSLPQPEENDAELEAAYQKLEAEQQELTDDDVECTGRIVTELVETGNIALPDRFMYAMRAIRGEFSEGIDETADTELAEDSLTSALLNFPATVSLRVVTRPLDTAAYEELAEQLSILLTTLDGAESQGVKVKERPGNRRSLEFALKVPDASSLSTLREALREDERVQMVF